MLLRLWSWVASGWQPWFSFSAEQHIAPPPYWLSSPSASKELFARLMSFGDAVKGMETQRRAILRKLLGEDVTQADLDRTRIDNERTLSPGALALSFLPPEKQQAVERIGKDFQRRCLEEIGAGTFGQEKRQRFEELVADRESAVRAVLTPDEWTQYLLHISPVAQKLRQDSMYMTWTPEEFQQVFNARQKLDTELSGFVLTEAGNEAATRSALEEEIDRNLIAVLGPERCREYVMKTSVEYRGARAFTEAEQLPAETAGRLYGIQDQAVLESRSLIHDTGRESESSDRLSQLRSRAMQELERVLGPDLANAYVESRAGKWIDQLGDAPPGLRGDSALITIDEGE